MHILESFSTSCGLKIDKPYIYEKYYPLNIEKYIILETHDNKYQAKNYDYWQEVVDIITQELKKNDINVLQLCGQNDLKITNAYTCSGFTTGQKAFLIRNSLLYVGSNSFGLSLASYYNKKIIGLFGNIYANQAKPYWSEEKDMVLLEGFDKNSKPSYQAQEQSKAINNIKPNEIAFGILDKLNLNKNIKYKYTYLGANYTNKTIEIVPNMVIDPKAFNLNNLIVRMDLEFNENVLKELLSISKCIIVSDKSISPELIKKYRENIIQVFYKIGKENEPEFIKLLKSLNIQYVLASYLGEEEVNKFKIDYMDLGLIIKLKLDKKENFKYDVKYYKSNNFIISNSKLYMSEAAFAANKPINGFNENIQEIIDTETFWRHAEKYAFLID